MLAAFIHEHILMLCSLFVMWYIIGLIVLMTNRAFAIEVEVRLVGKPFSFIFAVLVFQSVWPLVLFMGDRVLKYTFHSEIEE